MKFRKFILGVSLLVAAGSSFSISNTMESSHSPESIVVYPGIETVEEAQFDHKNWKIICKATCDVNLPNGITSTLQYFIKSNPKGTWLSDPKPSCSILMNNGAQIDYTPGLAAIWLTRNPDIKKTILLTGKFKGNDLFSYSAREFSDILMNADTIYLARPVHVTFSNDGSFPIQHSEEIRKQVIRKWIDHQIDLGNY